MGAMGAVSGSGRWSQLLLLLVLTSVESKSKSIFWFSDSVLNPGVTAKEQVSRAEAFKHDNFDKDLDTVLFKEAILVANEWNRDDRESNCYNCIESDDTDTNTDNMLDEVMAESKNNKMTVNVAPKSKDTWKFSEISDDLNLENKTETAIHVNTSEKSIDMTKIENVTSSYTVKDFQKDLSLHSANYISNANVRIRYCKLPTDLGPIVADTSPANLKDVEELYRDLSPGGWYKPENCVALHKVAIIVPYRDRPQQLAIFLRHMHRFLRRQQLDYGIYVIEQNDTIYNFNRAKLFNVGFVEANRARLGGWQCFIFHDVDLLPLDERNLYSCPRQPRHMSYVIDKYKSEDNLLFGGVSALTFDQMVSVNGYSNKYWGWGQEDTDMSIRLRKIMGYRIERYNTTIATYTMLKHTKNPANENNWRLIQHGGKYYKQDGLSSLRYKVLYLEKNKLFTLVSVCLAPEILSDHPQLGFYSQQDASHKSTSKRKNKVNLPVHPILGSVFNV